MQGLNHLIELLEMNLSVMSQVPSVYRRTEEALITANGIKEKVNSLEALLDAQQYENDTLTVHQIKTVWGEVK